MYAGVAERMTPQALHKRSCTSTMTVASSFVGSFYTERIATGIFVLPFEGLGLSDVPELADFRLIFRGNCDVPKSGDTYCRCCSNSHS